MLIPYDQIRRGNTCVGSQNPSKYWYSWGNAISVELPQEAKLLPQEAKLLPQEVIILPFKCNLLCRLIAQEKRSSMWTRRRAS